MAEQGRVQIRVHGRQRDEDGDVRESRTQAVARHDAKGGKHFFRYEDRAQLEGHVVPTILKLGTDALTLIRREPLAQRLEFFPQEERTSQYRTPYGNLALSGARERCFAPVVPTARGASSLPTISLSKGSSRAATNSQSKSRMHDI